MSTTLIIILVLVLVGIILVQVGKLTEIAAVIRGEQAAEKENNNLNAYLSVIFMVGFVLLSVVSATWYTDEMLGYGPNIAASEHGKLLDNTFNITLFFTGIVFIITQILLFWYAYKYRAKEGRVGDFIPHNNRLEIIWTAVPAVVMTFLVVNGLDTWNTVMADVGPDEEYLEIEATAQQFGWIIRYPGKDNLIGTRDYKLTTGINQLGQDWTDNKNHDDVVSSAPGEPFYLPKGKKVRVRIISKDVLHNFFLPQFRVKMDAVPGMPTYFIFTPTETTEEYRARHGALKKNGKPKYPSWHGLLDPQDPESGPRWKGFEYELACAELCGSGHYSMRRILRIVEQDEYDAWMAEQVPYYESTIAGTDDDPYKEQNLKKTEEAKAAEEKVLEGDAENNENSDEE